MPRPKLMCIAVLLLQFFPVGAFALTATQVEQICSEFSGDCAAHPLLQAYVGGALDLVAVLQEEGEFSGAPLYCLQERQLFDVAAIIRFMQAGAAEARDRNAMFLLVRYLKERGGCK